MSRTKSPDEPTTEHRHTLMQIATHVFANRGVAVIERGPDEFDLVTPDGDPQRVDTSSLGYITREFAIEDEDIALCDDAWSVLEEAHDSTPHDHGSHKRLPRFKARVVSSINLAIRPKRRRK